MPDFSTPRFRVLLIEDNPSDRELLHWMIEREIQDPFRLVHSVPRLEEGLELLRHGGIDLVLLDLSLPDSLGLETFRRARAVAQQVPILVLSGLEDEDLGLETMRLGAQEYLVKGRIDSYLLHHAMRYAIERARFEADLARERELFRTLVDHIPDRIYFKDRASRFLRINHALATVLRLKSPEEALGKSDAEFFGAVHAESAWKDEVEVMESGRPILNKVELEVTVDGRRSWLLTSKLPLHDADGKIIGTCGISREITQLKEMEEALAAERNLLRNVINNLPDTIYLKDTDGRYLLDNLAHQRWLGAHDSSEVIGRTVFDFYPDDIAGAFQLDDQRILESGKPLLNHSERILSAEGSERWVLTTKVPWHAEEGALRGLVCISRDVTEQKVAEAQLRQAYAELAQSREEVLGAMEKIRGAHEQLREVQLQLIEAEKMKSIGRLAAGIAHEVKNPLAILNLGIEFLSEGEQASDPTVNAVLSDMADAVKRADGVIRGLLDFSAPKKLEVAPENLNVVIERSLTLVRGEIKGIEVFCDLEPALPLLKLDATKIGQVFINLFTNAIHAMPTGGLLSVRTYARQLTGVGSNIADSRSESFRVGETLVVAEIDDTGVGIPLEKLGKVFEPFFTTKPTGKGTGLGLSVVKTIVDLHGGTVEVCNKISGGARVTLMFQV